MENWICEVCDYVYTPDLGDIDQDVGPGTSFDDLPDDWICPDCGADLESFHKDLG